MAKAQQKIIDVQSWEQSQEQRRKEWRAEQEQENQNWKDFTTLIGDELDKIDRKEAAHERAKSLGYHTSIGIDPTCLWQLGVEVFHRLRDQSPDHKVMAEIIKDNEDMERTIRQIENVLRRQKQTRLFNKLTNDIDSCEHAERSFYLITGFLIGLRAIKRVGVSASRVLNGYSIFPNT